MAEPAVPPQVAVHEAGHAYAAWRCGRACGPVTIRPGRRWAGMAFYGRGRVVPSVVWERLDAGQPVPLWPAAIRRRFEVSAIIAAAGEAAEQALWWPGRTRRGPDAVTDAAEIAAAMPPGRADELRLASAADTAGRSDSEVLAHLARALWPDDGDLAIAWISYMSREARALVTAGAPTVERLGAVLAERGSLSGRAVRAILAEP